jgi:uncharacterized membrane protein YgcG
MVSALRTLLDKKGLDQDEDLNTLLSSLHRSVTHLSGHAAQGVSMTMLQRRKAFIHSAGTAIHSGLKDWMLCQPFLPKEGCTPSLFGNVTGKVREFTVEERKNAANVALAGRSFNHKDNTRQQYNAPSATFAKPKSAPRGGGSHKTNFSGGNNSGGFGRGSRGASGRGGNSRGSASSRFGR